MDNELTVIQTNPDAPGGCGPIDDPW